MDKNSAQDWMAKFEALPQCVRLHGYEPGYNNLSEGQPVAVLNALNGMVLLGLLTDYEQKKGLLSKEKPEEWRVGLVTPVMAYRDTYGGPSMKATSLLSLGELEKLFAIWKQQGANLPSVSGL